MRRRRASDWDGGVTVWAGAAAYPVLAAAAVAQQSHGGVAAAPAVGVAFEPGVASPYERLSFAAVPLPARLAA